MLTDSEQAPLNLIFPYQNHFFNSPSYCSDNFNIPLYRVRRCERRASGIRTTLVSLGAVDMKVVIQNGCDHVLTRKELESMVPLFPASWGSNVKNIALYQGESPITVEFNKKRNELGLFCSKEIHSTAMKGEAITEMLIGLAYIAENKKLPDNLKESVWDNYFLKTEATREKCLLLVDGRVILKSWG